jgi:peroxiredoxin
MNCDAAALAPGREASHMVPESELEDLHQAFRRARDLDGSMGERLGAFAESVRHLRPAFSDTVDRFVHRLQELDAGENAPKPGEIMPPFMLPDENGRMLGLAELIDRGPAVVTFHRGHWCPYCRISMNTVARAQSRMDALGAQMVAIVPEKALFAAAMKIEAGIGFPILSDMDNGYATSLNLAVWIGGEMRDLIAGLGRDLPRYQGNDSWMLPIPATFVVGQDGRVKARFLDPDYRKRAAIEDLIAALQ